MDRGQKTSLVLSITGGTFAGIGIKTVMEWVKIPGYGIRTIPYLNGTAFGVDDCYVLAIGGLAIAFGSGKLSRPKKPMNPHIVGFGIGVLIGELILKTVEAYGGAIIPLPLGPETLLAARARARGYSIVTNIRQINAWPQVKEI
jgi:hypothetical protein